mmetsp:Transcript_39027/g.91111  ORF Transcript_39027/g.91111 Transcript_39027/m.91111 type:complete len:233 (-) Transcript_39027:938-1636(-)
MLDSCRYTMSISACFFALIFSSMFFIHFVSVCAARRSCSSLIRLYTLSCSSWSSDEKLLDTSCVWSITSQRHVMRLRTSYHWSYVSASSSPHARYWKSRTLSPFSSLLLNTSSTEPEGKSENGNSENRMTFARFPKRRGLPFLSSLSWYTSPSVVTTMLKWSQLSILRLSIPLAFCSFQTFPRTGQSICSMAISLLSSSCKSLFFVCAAALRAQNTASLSLLKSLISWGSWL